MPRSSPTWKELLQLALELLPSQKAAANALGISAGRFSRVAQGQRLGIANCLRLADLLQISPSVVLRAWHYETEAAILERAHPSDEGLTRLEGKLLEAFRALTPRQQRAIIALAEAVAEK